jgi:hypothetical protein
MGKSPRALALLLTTLVFSLAVCARMGLSRRRLGAAAAECADCVPVGKTFEPTFLCAGCVGWA